ncbi:hypothetical protein MKW98_030469, partial [Papaver atlanticum]
TKAVTTTPKSNHPGYAKSLTEILSSFNESGRATSSTLLLLVPPVEIPHNP